MNAFFTTPILNNATISTVYSKTLDLGDDGGAYTMFVGLFTSGMTGVRFYIRLYVGTGFTSILDKAVDGPQYVSFSIPEFSLGKRLDILAIKTAGNDGQVTCQIQPF